MGASNKFLVNLRLAFFTVAFVHLVVAAIIIFSIDMSDDPDPKVSAYIFVRFRLITCWFNIISMAYMPLCLYCEWKEKQGQGDSPRVVATRKIRDVIMTSILFPITVFADTLFWRLWYKDKMLIAPVRIFDYLPGWAHHSLHTVSLIVVVLDLLMVPRRRPRSLLPRLAVLAAFLSVYTAVLIWSYRNGTVVYSVFEIFETEKLLVLILYSYTECLFYFMSQWCILDLVWGRRTATENNHLKIQ